MAFDLGPHTHPALARSAAQVFFDRRELNQLLQLYGRMVSAGQWRDYAIDGLKDYAVFSVFRRASEAPCYRIEKRPALAQRQGAWSVQAQGGLVVRRGHDLAQVLRFFDRRRFEVVG
jgi:hypothetical protein